MVSEFILSLSLSQTTRQDHFLQASKHLHSSGVLKSTLETAKKFPSTANNDTKSTLQHTSNIERPDHTTMFTMNLTSTKPAIFCRKIVVQ